VPTVFRGRFRVVIYPNDHRPAHVHVIGPDCEAVFKLNCPVGPMALRENFGRSRRDLTAMLAVLTRNVKQLCSDWETIHGRP
jgi:hypothetical protein